MSEFAELEGLDGMTNEVTGSLHAGNCGATLAITTYNRKGAIDDVTFCDTDLNLTGTEFTSQSQYTGKFGP